MIQIDWYIHHFWKKTKKKCHWIVRFYNVRQLTLHRMFVMTLGILHAVENWNRFIFGGKLIKSLKRERRILNKAHIAWDAIQWNQIERVKGGNDWWINTCEWITHNFQKKNMNERKKINKVFSITDTKWINCFKYQSLPSYLRADRFDRRTFANGNNSFQFIHLVLCLCDGYFFFSVSFYLVLQLLLPF